jgi:molybdopterin molybdotransferase
MIPYEEALSIVLWHCPTLPTEKVYLLDALGRVLAEDVLSEEDRPSFDNSAMDGYAVYWEDIKDAPVELLVVGELPAGAEETFELPKGCAVKIFTGAPIPRGATAVVPVEYTEAKDGKVLIKEAFKEGANIRRKGEELKAGEIVLQKGTILRHYEIGLLASLNKVQVEVSRRAKSGSAVHRR